MTPRPKLAAAKPVTFRAATHRCSFTTARMGPKQPDAVHLRTGIAAPFEVASVGSFPGLGRLRLIAGCFDEWLERVADGSAEIALRGPDGGRVVAMTGARGLEVWADRRYLRIAVTTPLAVAALDKLARFPAMAIHFTPVDVHPAQDGRGPVGIVLRGELHSIECAAAGAFPGTSSGARPAGVR